MHRAPPRTAFPDYPASWYLYAPSRALGRRPLSRTMLGRQLVAFRTGSGRVAVLDGRCAHLGADLGGGRVVGDGIRCPYHHWEYGTDGHCTHIPGLRGDVPGFARQAVYPAAERHGYVFFFNGPEPLFPVPDFFDVQPGEVSASVPFRFVANCSWYLFASHAFDVQHFRAVHDRRLLGAPVIDCPAPFARRNRYSAQVEGSSLYDRLLRTLVSRRVDISITTWGGTLFFLTGNFRRAVSRFLVAAQPLTRDCTLAEGVVFTRRGGHPLTRALLDPISLWLRWLFTRGYLIDEARRLGSPRYNPATLLETDRDMIDFFHWMATLPQDSGPEKDRSAHYTRLSEGTDHAEPQAADRADLAQGAPVPPPGRHFWPDPALHAAHAADPGGAGPARIERRGGLP